MKKLFLSLPFFFFCLVVFAQGDREKIINRQAEFNATLLHPDSATFDKLLADSLSYGHSAWKIQTKKEFLADILHGPASFSNMTVTSQTVSIAGDNAIVRQVFQADLSSAGVASRVKLGILLVWTKQSGDWRLLARQAVKIP